jgi:hypothetical protein
MASSPSAREREGERPGGGEVGRYKVKSKEHKVKKVKVRW